MALFPAPLVILDCSVDNTSPCVWWPTRATTSIPKSALRTRFGTTSDFQTQFISTFKLGSQVYTDFRTRFGTTSKLDSYRPSNLVRKYVQTFKFDSERLPNSIHIDLQTWVASTCRLSNTIRKPSTLDLQTRFKT